MSISIHAPPRGATRQGFSTSTATMEFQFTPLREGRPGNPPSRHNRTYFNSRPSARGDGFNSVLVRRTGHHFNSRPSARGDGLTWQTCRIRKFQFTPLREGRRRTAARSSSCVTFQFTPLREGRQLCLLLVVGIQRISIHAPPRGATADVPQLPSERVISIHAPPRGATRNACAASSAVLFQFTPLREGRHCRLGNRCAADGISIHAPPRGATGGSIHGCIFAQNFNSRPSARGDRKENQGVHKERDFNSRPSARGDQRRMIMRRWKLISIHAPPRGATAR